MTLEPIIRRIRALIVSFAILSQLVGCSPKDVARERVVVAANPVLRSATLLLAADDTAAANGLDMQLKRFSSGRESTEAMLKGEADFASVAEFGFIGWQFDHPELRIVAVLSRVQATEVLARSDRGISKPSDLRGKSIGVVANSDAEFYLHGFLVDKGVLSHDVHIVPVPPDEISAALMDGKVDAVCTWEPFTYNLKQRLGNRVHSWPAQEDQDGYWLLVTREQVLKEKPQAAARLLEAIYQVEQNLRANPSAYRERLQALTGSSPDEQKATWDNYEFSLSLPQDLLVAMEAGARWRMATGMSPKQPMPNYVQNVDATAMDKVRPTAITLIR
jgi:NitT/TauT family transport system substrate-binding protein